VIALTASVLSKDREEASQAGMQGFATKPVDLPELEKEIARVLQTGLVTFEQQVPVDLMNDDPWQQALQRWGSEDVLTTAANAFYGDSEMSSASLKNHTAGYTG
jgi:CheY-like chemotaxis protein